MHNLIGLFTLTCVQGLHGVSMLEMRLDRLYKDKGVLRTIRLRDKS